MQSRIACFTPVQSPQSRASSKPSNATMFASILCRMLFTALGKIAGWFEDYNHTPPRLKMRSPREFIRAKTQSSIVKKGATPPSIQANPHRRYRIASWV
jgi:hypothetical protein